MNRKTEPKKPKKDVKKQFVRIFVLFLAFLMVAGSVVTVAMYLTADQRAFDAVPAVQAASTALFSKDQKIRVGLAFNDTAKLTVSLSSPTGFSFGTIVSGTSYTAFASSSVTSVKVRTDKSNSENTDHYAVLLPDSFGKDDAALASANEKVASLGTYAYRAVLFGKEKLLVGSYPTSAEAQAASLAVGKVISGTSVLSPTSTGLVVTDTSTDKILFKCDSGGTGKELGIAPLPKNGISYPYISFKSSLMTYGTYLFEGVFELKQYYGRIRVVNSVPLEAYVANVIYGEIGASYPEEAIKAFSVAVRNYVLNALNSNNGFDVTCTSAYQVYFGFAQNDTIRRCVKATEGIVGTYEGKLEKQYYSSSTGDCTVDSADIWGGTFYPYLRSRPTPWEYIVSDSNSSWDKSYTPQDLLSQLKKSSSCSALQAEIASVEILSTSADSTYVTCVRIKDKKGNSVTLTGSDDIRTAFDLKTANFVVGKGGQTVPWTEYGLSGYGNFEEVGVGFRDIDVITADGRKSFNAKSGIKAITDSGIKEIQTTFWLNTVFEKLSFRSYIPRDLPKTKESGNPDFNQLSVVSRKIDVTLPGSSGSFVFHGKGHGHGLGASQVGYRSLGAEGYTWKEIIGIYFPGTEFAKYYELKS